MYERGAKDGAGNGCLPGHVQWPRRLAQEDFHARRETHTLVLDIESIRVVPLLLDVVLLTSTLEALHVELL